MHQPYQPKRQTVIDRQIRELEVKRTNLVIILLMALIGLYIGYYMVNGGAPLITECNVNTRC